LINRIASKNKLVRAAPPEVDPAILEDPIYKKITEKYENAYTGIKYNRKWGQEVVNILYYYKWKICLFKLTMRYGISPILVFMIIVLKRNIFLINYTPQTQANNNSAGQQIQIDINAQNLFSVPTKSYICIKGRIVRDDNNNPYWAGDELMLINNAMMYIFSLIKYKLGSKTIESIIFLDK